MVYYYIMAFLLYVSLIRMYDNDIQYGCFFLQSLNRVASFICLLLGFFLFFFFVVVASFGKKPEIYLEGKKDMFSLMDLLYAPSHRQDSTYHGLCYTICGALVGTRNS